MTSFKKGNLRRLLLLDITSSREYRKMVQLDTSHLNMEEISIQIASSLLPVMKKQYIESKR